MYCKIWYDEESWQILQTKAECIIWCIRRIICIARNLIWSQNQDSLFPQLTAPHDFESNYSIPSTIYNDSIQCSNTCWSFCTTVPAAHGFHPSCHNVQVLRPAARCGAVPSPPPTGCMHAGALRHRRHARCRWVTVTHQSVPPARGPVNEQTAGNICLHGWNHRWHPSCYFVTSISSRMTQQVFLTGFLKQPRADWVLLLKRV
jgi:hypothetical protein